jgi:fructokinase
MTHAPKHHVVVAGEALMDLVLAPNGARVAVPGGGPFNTARALGRLGVPTTFLGPVSTDAHGEKLAAVLAADSVRLDPQLRTARPTSLAVATLNESGAATYEFRFSGTSAEGMTTKEALSALPANMAAFHAGSLGLVLEPLATAVEAAAMSLPAETLLMLDPNVRPSIIRDRTAHAARLERLLKQTRVVKASDDDLRYLFPSDTPEDAARAVLARGPGLVLLTLGAKGAFAFGSFGICNVPTPAITVIDTIGAGDIFSGAWLARWLELGSSLSDRSAVIEATSFACKAAAFSCTRKGAVPPTRSEIESRR